MDGSRINNTLGKMAYYLGNHNSICVSVSGGSDSDIIVHMIATYFREFLYKIYFVFVNTGLEYRATLRHLEYLEERYNIKIERVSGVPIPLAVKKTGVPFVSKNVSEFIGRLQDHGFDFSDTTVDQGVEKYGRVRAALRWWCDDFGDRSRFNISSKKGLKEILKENGTTVKISCACCKISKKDPLNKFQKQVDADLVITGIRKAEGGARANAYKNCFNPAGKKIAWDLYMPLFYWGDKEKAYYKETEGIVYSDCYEVWGMRRTGCVGCPFALNRNEELSMMKKYEPQMHKACMSVFGAAYELADKLEEYRRNGKK